MIVGYARTSTAEQTAGFEAQLRELAAAGCEKTYQEQVSSAAARKQLQAALEYVREGDILVVAKLDRLARSVTDLMAILQVLERKRVGVQILNLGMDTRTPTGKLMLTVLGAMAQFEREMMLERQRERIAKAKSEGRYKGRKPIEAERRQSVLQRAAEGATRAVIATKLGIGEQLYIGFWPWQKVRILNRTFHPIVPKTPTPHRFGEQQEAGVNLVTD